MADSPANEPRFDQFKAMPANKQSPGNEPAESTTSVSCQIDRASDRRLKKRESDRKCQRVSRQRKNTRIAYLESLVDQLKEADTSGQMDSLLQRISQLQKERDAFQGKLAAIEAILMPGGTNTHKEAGVEAEAGVKEPKTMDSVGTETQKEEDATAFNPSSRQEAMHFALDLGGPTISGFEEEAPLLPSIDPLQSETVGYQTHLHDIPNTWPETPAMDIPRTSFPTPPRPYLGMPSPTESTRSTSLFSSRSCSCGQAKALRMLQLNHWYHGNVTLGSWMEWPSPVTGSDAADPYDGDIAVRAIIEGWDVVAARGNVHPMWAIVRVMDEALFKYADGPMNRLGIIFGVSRLLMAHIEHSQAIYSTIPPFALESHGQDQYAYAANFVSWPGIRRALMTHEHKYCSNRFWRMFIGSMRIQWPFEVRDCYLYNATEASYTISPTFLAALNNIHALGVSRDFFEFYPELRGMAIAVDDIPPSIGTTLGIPNYHSMGIKNEGRHHLPRQWQQSFLSPHLTSRRLSSEGVKQRAVDEHECEAGSMPKIPNESAQGVMTATTTAPQGSVNAMLTCLFGTPYDPTEEERGDQGEDSNNDEGQLFPTPTWSTSGQVPHQAWPPEVTDFFAGRDFV